MNEPETSPSDGAVGLRHRGADDAAIEVVAIGGTEVAPDFDALLEARPRVPVAGPCVWACRALDPATPAGAALVLDPSRPRTARLRVVGYPPAAPRPHVVTCEIGGVTGGIEVTVRGRAPAWTVHPDGATVVLDDPDFLSFGRDLLAIERGQQGALAAYRSACARLRLWVEDLDGIRLESFGTYLVVVLSERVASANLSTAAALIDAAVAEVDALERDVVAVLPPGAAPEVLRVRLDGIRQDIERAEAAVNAAVAAVRGYVHDACGGADDMILALEVTKSVSFTILGAAGGAALGGSAMAGLAANTAADLLQRAVEHQARIELGLEPDSWERFWRESFKNLAINSAGAVGGAIFSGLSKGVAARIVDKVGLAAFGSATANLTRDAAIDFVKDGLGGAAGGILQTAVQGVWAMFGEEPPTWQSVLSALIVNVSQNGLGAALSARSTLQGGPFDVNVFDAMLAAP